MGSTTYETPQHTSVPLHARKKPVVLSVHQFWPEITPWPEGVQANDASATGYAIGTLERGIASTGQEVTPGDWIITGVKGEKYPCKADIFEESYELVTVEGN